jgi:hypothetical protein
VNGTETDGDPVLGCVDGFDEDEGASERDEGGDVLRGLLAAQGDAYEAFDRADALLDASSALIEVLGKNFGLAAAFWRYAMAAVAVPAGRSV